MTVRITNDMRGDITANVIKKTMAVRVKNLNQMNTDIANAIYSEIIGENLIVVSALPNGFMGTTKAITVKVGPYWKDKVTFELVDRKRFPHRFNSGEEVRAYKSENEVPHLSAALCERIKKYISRKEKIEEDKDKLRKSVMSTLRGVTTVKKLLTVWPDAEKYLPDDAATKKDNLPALPAETLNKMISDAMEDE